MNFLEFKKHLRNIPLVFTKDALQWSNNAQALRNQLNRWQQKKFLIRLRRGVYLLNEDDRKLNPSRQFIAGQLYGPSYISLESALNIYGLIPERVADVTSVTSRKTMRISNTLGVFIYQHIKPQVLRGFKAVKDGAGFSFFLAEPEKAIVDFLYLNLSRIKEISPEFLIEFFRFQNLSGLKRAKIKKYAVLFANAKLLKVVECLKP